MGIQFLFAGALLALPLAALPVVLHLLFRRKSPVVQFSTLRFVRMSVQHTAARKRVQRWLLLACRILLLLLLIAAVAQPARKLASNWAGRNSSIAAAVVVDTSYSMMLQDGQVTLLDKAGASVRDLLQGPLANARVAIFTSRPSGETENLQKTGSDLAPMFFKPLRPQAGAVPLGERVAAATSFLVRASAQQKWLIIISDLQTREFSHPVAELPDERVVLIDLHPDEARSAGITSVSIEPKQTLPGIGNDAIVEVAAHAGDSRAVTLSVTNPDGVVIQTRPPQMANFNGAGHAELHFPIQLPFERWIVLKGALQGEDAMAWDNTRTLLVEIPPRQAVTFLESAGQALAQRCLQLALDPSEGSSSAWPLEVKKQANLTGHESVVVLPVTEWPTEQKARQLGGFVNAGGTLILCMEPGLEDTWAKLDDSRKSSLLALLPSAPSSIPISREAWHISLAAGKIDPLLSGLTDDKYQIKAIVVKRFLPFSALDPRQAQRVTPVLDIAPSDPGPAPQGVLFRRRMGAGVVYTLGTMPDGRYTNLGTHPLFLPLMVRMALPAGSAALNVELGQPLIVRGQAVAGIKTLFVDGPGGATTVKIDATDEKDKGHQFQFNDASAPGIYTWHVPGESTPRALTNVTLPADESELTYRDAATVVIPGPRTLTARSFAEVQQKMAKINEPEALWSLPITVVLLLLCLEALMGSLSKLWKPITIRSVLSGFRKEPAIA